MKIVEVELSIEAKDDTIAAAKAARIKPLTPAGIKFLINHGAALSFALGNIKLYKELILL